VGQFGHSIKEDRENPYMFIGLIRNKNEFRGQRISRILTAMVVKYTDGLDKIRLRALHFQNEFEEEMFPHCYYAQKLKFLTDEMSEEDVKLWTNGSDNPSGPDDTPRAEGIPASHDNIDKWLRCFRVKEMGSEAGFHFQPGESGDTDLEELETDHMKDLRENFCDGWTNDLSSLTKWPALDMYLNIQEGARPAWLTDEIKTLDEMEKAGASYTFEPRT